MPRKVLYIYILSLVETNFKANYYNIKLLGDGYFKSFLISGSLIHLMSSNVVWIIFCVVFNWNVHEDVNHAGVRLHDGPCLAALVTAGDCLTPQRRETR